MKHIYLKTHWTPEEAHLMLSLLDELRDQIWTSYGSEMIESYQTQHHAEDHEYDEAIDDIIPF
ncbi:hypothetical protein CSB45_15995 [candidate division KSB3 bacterium]|uniref:Uncharacterized protein n=1 Tax=candidate division KSB3 bacterium TaxID=2044937 RepID=A0A2G6E0E2_9BACT|nr:MAG: hypothetical protein CSB45_15995 [candidate division KSB3 bacterium]